MQADPGTAVRAPKHGSPPREGAEPPAIRCHRRGWKRDKALGRPGSRVGRGRRKDSPSRHSVVRTVEARWKPQPPGFDRQGAGSGSKCAEASADVGNDPRPPASVPRWPARRLPDCLALWTASIAVTKAEAASNAVHYNQLHAIEDEHERARDTHELRRE